MEFLLAAGVTMVVAALVGKRKRKKSIDPEVEKRLKQQDEEIITVILPTIENDK